MPLALWFVKNIPPFTRDLLKITLTTHIKLKSLLRADVDREEGSKVRLLYSLLS